MARETIIEISETPVEWSRRFTTVAAHSNAISAGDLAGINLVSFLDSARYVEVRGVLISRCVAVSQLALRSQRMVTAGINRCIAREKGLPS